jgi:hypothetical protein
LLLLLGLLLRLVKVLQDSALGVGIVLVVGVVLLCVGCTATVVSTGSFVETIE